MNLMDGRQFRDAIERDLSSAKEIVIISAYITRQAISWLTGQLKGDQRSVTLVGRLSPSDIQSGASDMEALFDALQNGCKLAMIQNLHAKIYAIDRKKIYLGSANLTGNGLMISAKGNLEGMVQIEPSLNSLSFIDDIVKSAQSLDILQLEKMKSYVLSFGETDQLLLPMCWPAEIIGELLSIYVSDFPLSKPEADESLNFINPTLPFAVLDKLIVGKEEIDSIGEIFRKTAAYSWLYETVNTSKEGSLHFGALTKILHEALTDDPAPYRKSVKELLANLLEYVQLYASDEIEVSRPRHSQLVRIKKP